LKNLLIIIFLFLSLISYSQKIYRTECKDSAQFCIYESLFKSDTTYSVYIVKDSSEFVGLGNWYFISDKKQADYIIYFTNNKTEAQYRVFYIKKKNINAY
jgi:hypothetical protein